jgi:hypothetical protein
MFVGESSVEIDIRELKQELADHIEDEDRHTNRNEKTN